MGLSARGAGVLPDCSACTEAGSVHQRRSVNLVISDTGQGSDGGKRCQQDTNLTGLGVDVSTAEEFFYNLHVLLRLHGRQCRQHDRRVPRLVLVIDVTHVYKKETSLGRARESRKCSLEVWWCSQEPREKKVLWE